MSSFSTMNAKSFPNVPPPSGAGAKPSYGRFIPREELEGVQAWRPDSLGGEAPARPPISAPAPKVETPPPPPPPPDPREILATVRQAGYQDGLRDGQASAEAFKQNHARQVATQLGALVQSFDQAFAELENRMAETLTRTAVELAKQIVREELRQHPEHIARVAHDALDALMLSARHVRVFVHPDDVSLVQAGAADTLKARGAHVLADASLSQGDCRIESDIGSVEALVAQRWKQTAAQLGVASEWSAAATEPDPPEQP